MSDRRPSRGPLASGPGAQAPEPAVVEEPAVMETAGSSACSRAARHRAYLRSIAPGGGPQHRKYLVQSPALIYSQSDY